MFNFSSRADTSQHEKVVQESTEGQQEENMCHKSLDNEGLGENEEISTDYEYWSMPREIEESSASEEDCSPGTFASERTDKRLASSSSYEDDYQWLYFTQTKRG